jgi:hypothetical protein
MANKRTPLKFPELDELEPQAKGRRAILRTVEEVEAEEQLLVNNKAGKPENQKTSIPENKYSSNPESRKSSNPENKYAGIPDVSDVHDALDLQAVPESQDAGNRNRYPKVTYRLNPDAIDAIEVAKRLLRRQYNMKVSLEEIAEEAILEACNDLLKNQKSSKLVNKFSGKLKNQKSSDRP